MRIRQIDGQYRTVTTRPDGTRQQTTHKTANEARVETMAKPGWRVPRRVIDMVDEWAARHGVSKNTAAAQLIERGYTQE